MPEPVRAGQRYLPGLDGLRALAVIAVIAFHEQLGWAPGGLLGVGVFFTLSGYLITDLLLAQWAATGRLALADFWLRRARRLLPALFVMLIVVSAWVTVADRAQLARLRGAVTAAATYSSNWYLIIENQSYFARFAPPAPLDHLWSLAVEEQFYLIWPWLLLAGLFCLRRLRKGRPAAAAWLAVPTLALAAGSVAAMLALYHPGLDPTRVYEGTDTRAAGVLIGAALAMVWPSRSAAADGRARTWLDVGGFAGLAVIAVLIWRTGQYSAFLYRGGLIVLSVATAAVIAAAATPGARTGRVLGWAPLRWLGVRSYGIYLWHFPVIVLTTAAYATEDLTRAAVQTAATITIAALSWRYIEQPIRRDGLAEYWRRLGGYRLTRTARPTALAVLAATAGVLFAACAGLSGAVPSAASGPSSLPVGSTLPASPAAGGQPAGAPHPDEGIPAPAPSPAADLGPPRTSCQAVAHLGDSTSEGLVSPDYLPDPAQRLAAQYQRVGVQQVLTNIVGANSIVETLPGDTNGYDAARAMAAGGFRGCWVIALGTNDTADVAIGSNVSRMARIREMMSVAHGEPVMWVNVISLVPAGPYAEANMQLWNAALLQACARYPNMRIFNWAAQVEPRWFINDGIHYTSAGYAARAHKIATALARAFPAAGPSPGCVVS
jgi:peptidoglycan/LPS O-acetylase OafA/YrhL/lysophospholipase L1-like esterase